MAKKPTIWSQTMTKRCKSYTRLVLGTLVWHNVECCNGHRRHSVGVIPWAFTPWRRPCNEDTGLITPHVSTKLKSEPVLTTQEA